MLGTLTSFTVASFFVFSLMPFQPEAAQWGLVLFLTLIGLSFFYEWYLSPRNTKFGAILENIFHLSHQRTRHLTPKQALFDVKVIFVAFAIIGSPGYLSWKYPAQEFWFKMAITILSGIARTYAFNEEFKSPKGYRQRYIFLFSLLAFVVTILVVYWLSALDVKYSRDRHEFPIFIITIGAWFPLELLAQLLELHFFYGETSQHHLTSGSSRSLRSLGSG